MFATDQKILWVGWATEGSPKGYIEVSITDTAPHISVIDTFG